MTDERTNKQTDKQMDGQTDRMQGSNFSSHTRKMSVKKQLARWYFLNLHFLASGNLGLLSVVLIQDINLLSSSLNVVR